MSDFEALKADQSFAGELLRSAAADAPSARARRLAAASLGMVATTSVVPSAIAAGQALGATTQVVAPVGVKSISALVVAKWLASSFVVGVVASSSAITAYEVVASPAVPEATHATPGTMRVTPSAPRATGAAVNSTPVLAPNVPDPDVIPPPPMAVPGGVPESSRVTSAAHTATRAVPTTWTPAATPPPSAPNQPAPPAADATSLDAEIAWLEPARRALQARDGHGALAAVDQAAPHVRLLASEAALMRVEALLLVGRRAEAERLAQPFLDRHPSSPHAQRLRQMLGQP